MTETKVKGCTALSGKQPGILQAVYKNISEEVTDSSVEVECDPLIQDLVTNKLGDIMIAVRRNTMYGYPTITEVQDSVDANYATTSKGIEKLEENNLLMSKTEGREKKVQLTDKGGQVAEKLSEIKELCR